MDHVKTVTQLCEEHNLDLKALAERTGLDEGRVRAILEGRWTPSPAERDRIAAVFGVPRDAVAWGHTTSVQHLYGHGPQFGRTP
jgi:transcriptional regulator with XRE-family HTH domain